MSRTDNPAKGPSVGISELDCDKSAVERTFFLADGSTVPSRAQKCTFDKVLFLSMYEQPEIPFSASLPLVMLTTDGACVPNPGHGAWAYALRFGNTYKELSGYSSPSTNNRMEMQAVIEGLKALKRPARVNLKTDSMILVHLINGTGKKAHKRANQDLVQEIVILLGLHKVSAEWVKGHNGDLDNERCDFLCELVLASRPIHPSIG